MIFQTVQKQTNHKLIDTKFLGHREHIKLYEACNALLSTSKDSGAYGTLVTATNRIQEFFDNILLDEITNRDLCRWVEHERKLGIKDIIIRLWSRQFNTVYRNAKRIGYSPVNMNGASGVSRTGLSDI